MIMTIMIKNSLYYLVFSRTHTICSNASFVTERWWRWMIFLRDCVALQKKIFHNPYFCNYFINFKIAQDPNFKWCYKCPFGFLADPKNKKLVCIIIIIMVIIINFDSKSSYHHHHHLRVIFNHHHQRNFVWSLLSNQGVSWLSGNVLRQMSCAMGTSGLDDSCLSW